MHRRNRHNLGGNGLTRRERILNELRKSSRARLLPRRVNKTNHSIDVFFKNIRDLLQASFRNFRRARSDGSSFDDAAADMKVEIHLAGMTYFTDLLKAFSRNQTWPIRDSVIDLLREEIGRSHWYVKKKSQ